MSDTAILNLPNKVDNNFEEPKNPWPTRVFILLLALFVSGVSLFLPKRNPTEPPKREHKINPTFVPMKDNKFGYPDWIFKQDALFKTQAEKEYNGSDEDFYDYEWVKYYVSYCKGCKTAQCLRARNFVASRLLIYAINSEDPQMLGKVFSYITNGSFAHGDLKMFFVVIVDPLDPEGSYTFIVFAENFEKASEAVAQFARKGYEYVVVNLVEVVIKNGVAVLQKYVATLDGGKFDVSLEPLKRWLGFKVYKILEDIEIQYKLRKGKEDPLEDPTKPPRGFSEN